MFQFQSLCLFLCLIITSGFVSRNTFNNNKGIVSRTQQNLVSTSSIPSSSLHSRPSFQPSNIYGNQLVQQRGRTKLHDLLGFGPAEIAITLVLGLVLFGPETLKSLSKDVGRAAAELKEIPKTFKEGMDEGAQSSQVSRMKELAAEKRKKRDEKLAALDDDEEGEEGDAVEA